MIYFLYGSDREAIIKRTDALVEKLRKDEPGILVERYEKDNFEAAKTKDLAGAQSLFGNRSVVILDDIFGEGENMELLPTLAESENIFIVREGELKRDPVKHISKLAKETEELNAMEKTPKAQFNPFSLTDALASRDKKNAWILYEKALLTGQVAEEIFWRVMWQVKALLLAKRSKSAVEADLKPFVYNKSKSALRNWKEGELEALSENLTLGYHRARRGEGEIETLLEKVFLKL